MLIITLLRFLNFSFKIKFYFETGYDDESENTWEPQDNLDCDDKIQEFEKKHKVN